MDRARAPPQRSFRAIGLDSTSAFQPASNSVGPGHPSLCVPAFSPAVELLGQERHFLCPLGRYGLVPLPRTMPPMSGGVLWFPPPAPPDSSLGPRHLSHRIAGAAFALGRSYAPRSS